MTAGTGRTPAPIAACTIASNNYLGLAAVFADSYRRHHPGAEVFVAVADRPDPRLDYSRFPFRTVFAAELGIPAFPSLAFRYELLELNTAIKPWLFAWLRDRQGLDRALYFDPDILVADRLGEVEAALESAEVALVPHVTAPLDDAHRPSDRQIRMAGIYNLGFLGLRLDASTAPFLAWWQQRLERFCLVDPHHGLFVDQAWMDFAPAFLDRVAILRSPRLNVAYWNLAARDVRAEGERWTVDGQPLGFFHFSGIELGDLGSLSRHQDRLAIDRLPAVRALFERYRELALAAGQDSLAGLPYGFGAFRPGGPAVSKLLRRTLLRVDPHGRRFTDPFDRTAPDSFFAWLGEPLRFAIGSLTRAALSVWESRPELVARFPQVVHLDLPAFAGWLIDQGGGAGAGVPAELLAGVEVGVAPARLAPYQQEPLRPFLAVARPETPEALEAIDLAAPGAWLAWLLEPFPGAGAERPWLTRLAMLLWQRHPSLQRALPDPLGRDLDTLAVWLARAGRDRLGLAAEIEAGLAALLPTALAASVPREIPDLEAAGGETPPRAVPAPSFRAPPRATGPRAFGVLVLAAQRREPEAGELARGMAAALAEAGVAHDLLDLDADLLGNAVEGLFSPPTGSPWPVLLSHLRLRLAPWRFGWLAAAATQGGRRIGYLDSEVSPLPPAYRERLTQWDEIWTPSRFAQEAIAPGAPIPVRWVPPCRPRPSVPALPPRPRRIEARFRADDPLERDDPWTVLAAARRLAALAVGVEWRLELAIEGLADPSNPAAAAAELLAALATEAADLPVDLLLEGGPRPAPGPAAIQLSLHRSGEFRPDLVGACQAGRILVATAYGAATDLLDASTGFPVAFSLAPLGRSFGPAPGSTPVATADAAGAAEALARALTDGAEARRRAAAGQARAEELYGPIAAGARLLAELDRLRDALAAG